MKRRRRKSPERVARDYAWRWMSKYIRLRDCLETMDSTEYGRCVTCEEIKDIKKLDAGHFVPGRLDSVMWIEENCHAQCPKCNRFQQGRWADYQDWMIARYGQARVNELLALRHKPVFMGEEDYRRIGRMYKQKYHALEEQS